MGGDGLGCGKGLAAWPRAPAATRRTCPRPCVGVAPHRSSPITTTYLRTRADDVYVRLSCGRDGRVTVESQGQLRLGVGDLGANARRNAGLLGALRAAAADGSLPAGSCSARWRRPLGILM